MRLRTKGMRLHTFKITIKPLEWELWPHWTGSETPNIREIFILCFRINIYLESRKTAEQKTESVEYYKKLYGVKN
jgi:hypothetical protein